MGSLEGLPGKWNRMAFLFLLGSILNSCALERKRRVSLPPSLHEISGLIYSEANTLWAHNDGGNPALLYHLDREGALLDSFSHPQWVNRDMEAMAKDDSSYLYIGDIGNNLKKEIGYRIYKISLDSFHVSTISFTLPQNQEEPTYPNFEAMFWLEDSLWLFSKSPLRKAPFYSDVYVVPDGPGQQTASWKGRLSPPNFAITGAAIDREHTQIVLVGYRLRNFLGIPRLPGRIWVLPYQVGQPFWQEEGEIFSLSPWGIGKPFESVDFLGEDHWILGSEKSPIHSPQLQEIKVKRKFHAGK